MNLREKNAKTLRLKVLSNTCFFYFEILFKNHSFTKKKYSKSFY